MSYEVNKHGIVAGSVYDPATGAWSADVQVNTDEPLSGQVTLSLPGVDLIGTVTNGDVVAGRQDVRIIGGRGGLSTAVPGQPFRRETVRGILDYVLGKAGEAVSVATSDAALLARILEHWTHVEGTAGQALDLLAAQLGTSWSIAPDGGVTFGSPAWATSEPEHTLIKHDPATGTMLLGIVEASLRPGTTFRGQKIQVVEHLIDGEQVRQLVRYGSANELDQMILRLIEHALPVGRLLSYECEVVTQNADGTVDLQPTSPTAGPGWQGVEVALQGPFAVKVATGARCVLEFLDGDLTKPVVRNFLPGTTFTEMTTRGTSKVTINGPAIAIGDNLANITLAGSSKAVVRVGDSPTGLSVTVGMADLPVKGAIAIAVPSTVKA